MSAVQRGGSGIHEHTSVLFQFFAHMGHHRTEAAGPWAVRQVPEAWPPRTPQCADAHPDPGPAQPVPATSQRIYTRHDYPPPAPGGCRLIRPSQGSPALLSGVRTFQTEALARARDSGGTSRARTRLWNFILFPPKSAPFDRTAPHLLLEPGGATRHDVGNRGAGGASADAEGDWTAG